MPWPRWNFFIHHYGLICYVRWLRCVIRCVNCLTRSCIAVLNNLSSYFLSSVLIQDLFSPSHINIVLTLCWLPLQMSSFIPISSPLFHHPEIKHIFFSFFPWVHAWTAAGKFIIFFICFPRGVCLFSLIAQNYVCAQRVSNSSEW